MKIASRNLGFSALRIFALLGAVVSANDAFAIPPGAAGGAPSPMTPPQASPAPTDPISNLANSATGVAPTTAAGAAASAAAMPAPAIANGAAPPASSAAVPPPPAAGALPDATADADDTLPLSRNGKPGTTLEEEESSAPKAVNKIIRKLSKESENLTLNDMNSAQQAIVRIQTLIELEKKLAELDKVQKERENKSASAVPASMLMPPVGMVQQAFIPPPPVISEIDIDRIVGGAGNYKAVIKTADGLTHTVQVGDSLPDGSKVERISASSLDVAHGSEHRTVHVKNIDMVFGGSP